MITILENDCKTSIKEFTLKEFDAMNVVLNDAKMSRMDKNLEIIKIAGYKGDLKLLTLGKLKEYITALNKQAEADGEFVNDDLLKSIEIGGRNYVCYEEEILDELTAFDTGLICELPRKRSGGYITEAIAIMFKDDQLGLKEHYTPAHIEHKMNLFGSLDLAQFYPYVQFIVQNIINHVEGERNNDMLDRILSEAEQMNKAAQTNDK